MNSTRKISILIDNFNYGKYVGQAIESALAQTYPNLEVIVVDDGSTDRSPDVIRSYGNRIRAVFKENGGQSSAFNTAFAHSQGDIIMLLDSDDYLRPEAAAKIASAWTPATGALFHRLSVVDADGNDLGYHCPDRRFAMSSGDVVPGMLQRGGRYEAPTTSGMSFSREVFAKALPIPIKEHHNCADGYLRLRVPFLTPISVLDHELAYYRMHAANLLGGGTRRRLVTRKILEQRKSARDNEYALFQKLAAARGAEIPEAVLPFTADGYVDELLLDRSKSRALKVGARLKLAWIIVRQMRAEKTPVSRILRQMALLPFLCLAPRPILRRLYPQLVFE